MQSGPYGEGVPVRRTVLVALAVAGLTVVGAACSDSSGEDDEYNRIGRIDGPATVNDDAGADQDGAPADPSGQPDAITSGS